MISMSPAYRAAVVADSRRTVVRAVVEIISPDIVYGTVAGSPAAPTSIPEQLHDKVMALSHPYATFELNRWLLDGSMHILTPGQLRGQQGWASQAVCGADGAFAGEVYVEQPLEGVTILQACSVAFGDGPLDGLPADYTVAVMAGSTVGWSQRVTGPSPRIRAFTGFTVHSPTGIRVIFHRWGLPYRRARVAEIIPGIYEEWNNDTIVSVSIKQQGDPACIALPYGTMALTMDNSDRRFDPGAKAGIFRSLEERQGIKVYIGVRLPDGTAELAPVGVYYQFQNGWRTGANGPSMTWNMVDIIGLVTARTYAAPATLPTTLEGWLTSVCGQLGVNFSGRVRVAAAVAGKSVTANAREDVDRKSCGELIRFACMAAGAWSRAANDGGELVAEPAGGEGGALTLDNLSAWPSIQANADVARIDFTIYPSGGEPYAYSVAGTQASSSTNLNISNPFIHTTAQADTAAALILAGYGGNKVTTAGRGDAAREIGDLDTVQLNPERSVQGWRVYQTLNVVNGILSNCQSNFLVPDAEMDAGEEAGT